VLPQLGGSPGVKRHSQDPLSLASAGAPVGTLSTTGAVGLVLALHGLGGAKRSKTPLWRTLCATGVPRPAQSTASPRPRFHRSWCLSLARALVSQQCVRHSDSHQMKLGQTPTVPGHLTGPVRSWPGLGAACRQARPSSMWLPMAAWDLARPVSWIFPGLAEQGVGCWWSSRLPPGLIGR